MDFIQQHLAILHNIWQYKATMPISQLSHPIPSTKARKSLLPRRQELVNIIGDHPYTSLDSLSRRFPTTPKRTIAYDVNYLVKNNFVIKHGETRGVRYSLNF